MQIEDVYRVSAEFCQAFIQLLLDRLCFMITGLQGEPLGCDLEAMLFPACLSCEGFLLSADIDAGRVEFVVALGLEVV
jgi:hypothetical protein